ncbi:complement C3-like [Hyperolius riggenbachi]|uniref:complement C3-like n=1 Tax=Hyperolius riggenbachi TaxID=752182 RepID=UPI0035A2B82F
MRRGVLLGPALLLTLLTTTYAQLPCTLIMPSILRVETQETIIVDAQLQKSTFEAGISIKDFPQRTKEYLKQKVSVNSTTDFIGSVSITIPSKNLLTETKQKQYVIVIVSSSNKECNLEKVALLSFHSGYIFIQTDKPIYNPGTQVKFRVFVTGLTLAPDTRVVEADFTTPDGIVVYRDKFSSGDHAGIVERTFNIPEIVTEGRWKISARLQVASHDEFQTEFEVKEYVLPSFEVLLETPQNHYFVDDSDFTVNIAANFLHGKPVEGSGYAIFGVMDNNEKRSLPSSLTNVTIIDGTAEVKLERYMITPRFPDLSMLVGRSLYVTVTVLTNAGSDMVEAEKTGIPVVNTAFKISFTKSSKYFKPGLPYMAMLLIQNPDGSPADSVPFCTLEANQCYKTKADGTGEFFINTKSTELELNILVRTNAPADRVKDHRQTTGSLKVAAYRSQGGYENFLHISADVSNAKLGDNFQIKFNVRNEKPDVEKSITHITYMVISKGRVIKIERIARQPGQTLIVTSLVVTKEHIPSFRLLAYYVVPGAAQEIISDALWVPVTDSCIKQLQLTEDPRQITQDPQPGTPVYLKLTGDPKASVGLVAVDKAVFVLNKKNVLSQSKVWEEVERSDLGCTPGGGSNSAGVFTDAGLSVQSTMGLSNPTRKELHCEEVARKRRSAEAEARKREKAQEYKDPNLRKCCEDGMKENPMGYTCQQRFEYVLQQGECAGVFLECCKFVFEPQTIRRKKPQRGRPSVFRPGSSIVDASEAFKTSEDDYISMGDFQSRSVFPESWMWKIEKLPDKADANGFASKTFTAHLKDSITTWSFQAISLSDSSGICVAKPFELLVKKHFFIDLRLPFSVVRNEQVEIRAVLYSYVEEEIEVLVDLYYNEKMCSAATRDANFRQRVTIAPGGIVVLPFIIVPLEVDDLKIEVKATVKELFMTDGVVKLLKVVPEGMRIMKRIQSVILDPLRSADASGAQVVVISTIPPNDIVPNTEPETYISVKGSLLGETLENSIDGTKLKHLITVPSGCGEQIMMSMTPTVIATRFLDVTNLWETIGFERRAEAIKNIEQGYVQQMTYRKPDNSYSAFTNRPSSTWLTAYVVKVFAMSTRLINVEKEILCGAMKWLLSEKQLPNGVFKEDAPVIHGEMVGGTGNTDPDASLTAFVVIALVEAKSVCEKEVPDLDVKLEKSVTFLAGLVDRLKKPYTICITSYALSLLGRLPDHKQLLKSSTDSNHWADYSADLYMIEATSYGLLALLNLKQYILAAPVARWLTEQRYYGGGYGSTQATIMVFQALSEYQTLVPQMNEVDMDVKLTVPGRQRSSSWKINKDNSVVQRSEKTVVKDKLTISAVGTGQGTVTVMSVYYAPLAEGVATCKNFEFSVTVEEVPQSVKKPIDALQSLYINICMKYLGSYDATMTVVDMMLLTGYTPDMDDLGALTNRVDRYISKYEMDTERSERGSLIIYLDKVSRTQTECVKFKIHKKFEVGILQPATVSIYEYYGMGSTCTKFYHPTKEGGELKKICKQAECQCVSERCNLRNVHQGVLDAKARLEEACLSTVDYVYEARVEGTDNKGAYDIYTMTITRVVKLGSDTIRDGQTRQFFSHQGCRDSVKIQEGRSYLIWGRRDDLWEMKNQISYVINGGTWLELVPTHKECATIQQKFCDEMEDFIEHITLLGCSS